MLGVAVYLRTERAAAKRMMLDWLQIDVGQHVRDGDRARYHITDRVLECPDVRVRSDEVVPICMVGLEGLLALRSSRREVFHADSVHRKRVLDQGRRRERALPSLLDEAHALHCALIIKWEGEGH